MSSRRKHLALASGVAATCAAAAAVVFTRRRVPASALTQAVGIEPFALQPPGDRRRAEMVGMRRGEPGSGGYYGTWKEGSPDAVVAEHIKFQYAGMEHQSETALSGMWLFVATEILFFGGLFLLYMIYRSQYPQAFAVASDHAELTIGTINTVLLLSSSAVFAWGLGQVRHGDNRRLFRACVVVAVLGAAFLLLKGREWKADLDEHLFPGPGFAINGPLSGGAQLFWIFYWVATGLHGLHMIVGIGLVTWLGWTAREGRYSPGYITPVEVVGLYWSFVDMVWLCLYPMIYLVGGGS